MKVLKSFILNTVILLFSTMFLQLIQIFFGIYISNTIGEEAVGIFSLIMSVYTFGITLASAGINIAATRVISEELACQNNVGAKKIAKKCIFLGLIFGACAGFIFFILDDFIIVKCLHNQVNKKVIHLICIALPFISMSSAINGYFTAVRRVYKNAIAKFCEEFVKITFTIYLIKFCMFSRNQLYMLFINFG